VTVQTPVVDEVKVTGSPELELAEKVVTVPKFRSVGCVKETVGTVAVGVPLTVAEKLPSPTLL
jgi:hypothetical protein